MRVRWRKKGAYPKKKKIEGTKEWRQKTRDLTKKNPTHHARKPIGRFEIFLPRSHGLNTLGGNSLKKNGKEGVTRGNGGVSASPVERRLSELLKKTFLMGRYIEKRSSRWKEVSLIFHI